MTLKQKLARLIERCAQARFVKPGELPPLFEQEHLHRFFDYFKIDCVFDVGANVGQYATMIRRHAGYRGPIVSFEPNPDVAERLRHAARDDDCWFVEEVALGAKCGDAQFNVTAVDQMGSLHEPQTTETDFFVEAGAIQRVIDVKISTLEVQLAAYRQKLKFERPFLKMDTQGHDIEVASGAGTMLLDFVGLQSELAIKRLYANTWRWDDALKFYVDRGFVLSAFVPNNAGFFPYLFEIDCIMFNKNYGPPAPEAGIFRRTT
jgi:FkbM family methyltransferase